MRAYVTGGHGFVGEWLDAHLRAEGDEVTLTDRNVDVTDAGAVREAVSACEPDVIYHLAALASVGDSWRDPARTFTVNAVGTLHVLEAARACAKPPKVLLVCSAEVYGLVTPDDLPLTESSPLRPATPYAVSKVAAEFLGLQAFLSYGLPVVMVRAFNHVGPGQATSFVVSDIGRQLVAARPGERANVRVGNIETRRDITDVRDVVRAYRLLMERGEPGEVYNVCSGRDVAIKDLIDRLIKLSGVDCELVFDPSLTRPVDIPVLRGDPSKLRAATGWEPIVPVDQTLIDVLESLQG